MTDPHRAEARRCITVAGYPPPADDVDRARRRKLIDAMASAIADVEEAAYRHGLGQAFAESLAVLTAPDPAASIRHIARSYGVVRDLDGPPGTATAAMLRAAWAESHDVGAEALTGQRPDPEAAHAAAADRLSWSGAEGLIITPPPADPS